MRSIPFLFLAFTLLAGCRKDPEIIIDSEVENDTIICAVPNDSSIAEIVIGDTTGMRIFHPNYSTESPGGYQNTVYFDFAVWCENTLDVRITSIYYDGPGPGNSIGFGISSLNSVAFLHNKDSLIFYEINDTAYSGSNPTEMIISNGKSCSAFYNMNPIHSTEDALCFLDLNDTFGIDDYFLPEGQIVRPNSFTIPDVLPVENDTQKIINYPNYSGCQNLGSETIKYLGIKIIVEDKIKLGWIKLEIQPGAVISIYEIAVQK